jgi:hypothetical protein
MIQCVVFQIRYWYFSKLTFSDYWKHNRLKLHWLFATVHTTNVLRVSKSNLKKDRVVAHADGRLNFNAEARILSHVGFVVGEVALGEHFLRILGFSPVHYNFSVVPP